ncbi:MAG: succinate dehydrogenase, hydrophobic membrane anchor protein [Pseudolabrys sp.]|nr:succinate dehydrogenase, hydrophobic membrane anchor protein [Pseudolabrys sp.]MBV9955742.1 succinate dehydrogenase, hydrophobic membrane anchor protein [Pseudolabrys sp.]
MSAGAPRNQIRSPIGRVRGFGPAHSGTHHFWHVRVTSVALLILTIVFVVIVISLLGRNQPAVVRVLGSPAIAVLMLLFVGGGIYHMWIGMQEILIDYVHSDRIKLLMLIGNTFFCMVIGVLCVFSILKLSFGI